MPRLTHNSQCARILAALEAADGGWVPMPQLVVASGSFNVHSRIHELRHVHGILIENETDVSVRPHQSLYRLIPSPAGAGEGGRRPDEGRAAIPISNISGAGNSHVLNRDQTTPAASRDARCAVGSGRTDAAAGKISPPIHKRAGDARERGMVAALNQGVLLVPRSSEREPPVSDRLQPALFTL